MQPQNQPDQFQPKWRHFHPQSTVWLVNPFDHDVIFRVADENNNQSEFRIKARERAELPGGNIATLGLKCIIDELIQNNKDDVLRLYDKQVREKYEEDVILRVKEAPSAVSDQGGGSIIDLSVGGDKKEEVKEEAKEESAFAEVPKNPQYTKTAPPIAEIAQASVSGKDQIVEE